MHVVLSDNQSKKKEKNKKVQQNLNETVSPTEIFSLVTGLEELLELIIEQSDLYAYQK